MAPCVLVRFVVRNLEVRVSRTGAGQEETPSCLSCLSGLAGPGQAVGQSTRLPVHSPSSSSLANNLSPASPSAVSDRRPFGQPSQNVLIKT